jgi:hypothetical protein
MIQRMTARAMAAASLVAVAACGGGGGGGDATPPSGGQGNTASPAQGVYGGPLTGARIGSFQAIVLDDATFWVIYGFQLVGSFQAQGFVQGTGAFSTSSFTATNVRDFGVYPAAAGSASGTFDTAAKTITGTTAMPSGTVGFSGGPIAGSSYNYTTPALLSAVVGNWTIGLNTGESAALSVSAAGAVVVQSSGGCRSTGTVAPRASGKNVFDVALTFGGAPCLLPGVAMTGVAVAYPMANGRTQLLAAAHDAARTAGFLAAGVR